MIILIAALGKRTRAIGKDSGLIWDIPTDLARFRDLTRTHPIVMGRKTWEALPENRRPLPNRTNIVITRNAAYAAPGAELVTTIEEALALAKRSPGADEIYVIGGGDIFGLALPCADRLDLTEVDDDTEGDAHFPPFSGFIETKREPFSENGISYDFVTYERDPSANA